MVSRTGIGIGIGIPFMNKVKGGGVQPLPPDLQDALVGVWIADQNNNDSSNRDTIKNKIPNAGGDFELLNFAYKLNSGYGKYEINFTTWLKQSGVSSKPNKFTIISNDISHTNNYISWSTANLGDVPKFKIKISGIKDGVTVAYRYYKDNVNLVTSDIRMNKDGIYDLPYSYSIGGSQGFKVSNGKDPRIIGITIEQIPSFQGALVTDGVNDLIASTKTMQEMLDGSNEMTVVSMIHQISPVPDSYGFTNYIREGSIWSRTNVKTSGKTGIYGYKISKGNTEMGASNLINNILGDKADYEAMGYNITNYSDINYSVTGYIKDGSPTEVSSVAWYWTFIAKKALTTDQINQVIAYYNLDKYVKPDIYYDVKKQGLSNDTPEADWYLKDFSGNGHDMQLYNFAKKLGSGIGKYEVDFNTWIPQSYVADSAYTSNKLHITNIKGGNAILYTKKGVNAMKVKITGIQSFNLVYRYIAENDVWEALKVDRDGIYELPASTTTTKTYYTGFTVPYYTGDCDITIEQIPDYEGALVSDGIDDYGKVENLPIYKDYTVVADREIIDGLAENADGGVAVRGTSISNGAFGFDYKNEVYSFATPNSKVIDVERFISYQSKYVNNGTNINAGNIVDANPLTIGKLGSSTDRYSKLALWSFLLFPYSLSEFLLERQLKRYKLGTLYSDMVEFRPIVKSNVEYELISFATSTSLIDKIVTGDYMKLGTLYIYVKPKSDNDKVVDIRINGIPAKLEGIQTNGQFRFKGEVSKSPQKIDITIDEYIRYEDIIQPYPAIVNLKQDGKTITWGDKLKVGSEVTFVNHTNLLPELYAVSGGVQYNDTSITWNTPIRVEKSMTFTNVHSYKKANEPNCILAPQTLKIPNASYKILGYIPDLTGKGNHGVFNNFAFTEESVVNEDGSIHFNGVDDFITIPTLSHGAKQVLMKVNWNSINTIAYDHRTGVGNNDSFAIYLSDINEAIAYNARNNGQTYIDGILNTNIVASQLKDITHNITITNNDVNARNSGIPRIGSAYTNSLYTQMALFSFMSFDDISSEDEIKELNDIVGIEGGYVESPDYYWDAYGKANRATQDIDYLDLNQASNAHQVLIDKSKAGLAALELYHNTGNTTELNNRKLVANNFAFNEESGYGGWLGVGDLTTALNYRGDTTTNNWKRGGTFLKDRNRNDNRGCGYAYAAWFDKANYILKFKVKITGLTDADELYICQYNIIDPEIKQQLFNGINEVILDLSASINPTYQYISFRYPPLTNDVDFEFLYEYPNGLVSDGVDDHLINGIIPAFTDFTVISKRKFLNTELKLNETFCMKGDNLYSGGVGNAFVMEYFYGNDPTTKRTSMLSFGRNNIVSREESDITWCTPTSYNNITINRGEGGDTVGLSIGKIAKAYWKGVFYKMMLYSKTIDMLSINMLKNLFAKDELIDVNNPIFKK